MTTQISQWFEHGEPIDGERVEAQIRTTYQTGPNGPDREDGIEYGTIGYETLDLLGNDEEIHEHLHDDGAVLLSALPDGARDSLLETFEPVDPVEDYIRRGCSAVEAVDYWATEDLGYSQRLWGEVRDVGQDTVSRNVSKAEDVMGL